MEKYKNKSLAVEERVEDLLSRMTLKEKTGQLIQNMCGWNAYKRLGNSYEITDAFKEEVAFGDGVGALYGLFRADPWSKVTFENGIALEDCAKVANTLQRYVLENTRLGIPLLISEECPHGHQALDGTLFPTNIGVGSSWNPVLYEEAISCAAAEIRARGGTLGLVSALDVLREPRWGRSEECFSEDPYIVEKMALAAVRGLQGKTSEDLKRPDKLAAVLKHFCAQGACLGGRNAGPAVIGERELREIHLSGMKGGISEGVAACMAAYNEIDGIPCHSNKNLLTDILRKEMGFNGVVMSDGYAVDFLISHSGDLESAGAMALNAGVDLSLWNTSFTKLEAAVRHGKLKEKIIDNAVEKVLMLKFSLGLFDKPYTDGKLATAVVGCEAHRSVNLRLARESIVLLKNENGILPLKDDLKRISVIGPNADNIYNQLGDYTSTQRENRYMTVLSGLKAKASDRTEIIYSKGCSIRGTSKDGFNEAILAAKSSDVVVLVLGGCSTRDFNIAFENNGAAVVNSAISQEMNCGEGPDMADLELDGVQIALAQEIIATGKPVVVVLIQGRPHSIPWIAENCEAILCAWYPGQEGGMAVAEILFGEVNPSGKLAVSIPRSSAQLPVFYNSKDISDRPYVNMTNRPLYHFGYGLSYTTYEYENLRLTDDEITVEELEDGHMVKVSIDVKNTGKMAGDEVVQLYIKDMEASITRRIKELKGFKKIRLNPDEMKTVTFLLGKDELGIWNIDMKFAIEPGNVKIIVGSDSKTSIETILKIK